MIGSCDLCDKQNVAVSHFSECFAHPEAHACFICQGEDDPDPYGEMGELREDLTECQHALPLQPQVTK